MQSNAHRTSNNPAILRYNEMVARETTAKSEIDARDHVAFRAHLEWSATPRLTALEMEACADDLVAMMREDQTSVLTTFNTWHARIKPASIQSYARTLLAGRK